MRTKQQILKDYLVLLNEENKLGYSLEEIEKKLTIPEEIKVIERLLLDELYDTIIHQGQTISSERAFYVFCTVVIYSDLKTGRRIWNSFVKKQFSIIEQNKQVCYMAHRGAGKTFFFSLYSIFKMFILPYFDVCYATNTPSQRKRFLKTTESIIDNNEFLLEKKNVKKTANKEIPWGIIEMEYNNGALEGTTVGTTPRGGHYNLVIGDDPLRDDQKYTYEFIVNYFQGVLKPTTYTKKARYIIGGTPQNEEDLFHTLMNAKLDKHNRPIGKIVINKTSQAGFYSAIFPAILNFKTKEVLIPEVWTYDELISEREKIGSLRFSREMLCSCTSFRNSLISNSLFNSCCDEKETILQRGKEGKKYVLFVDSATSDAPTADFCAITVWEDIPYENKFIFRYLFHERGHPITDPTGGINDQINKVVRLHNDFNKALIVIEKNNAGVGLIQGVRAKGYDVIEHYTQQTSRSNSGKAEDISDYIEKGLKTGVVIFPSNPDDNLTIEFLEKIKSEHLSFGVKKGKSGEKYEALSGHDDIFDSCYGAWKHRSDKFETLPFGLTLPGISTPQY